jgi:hypothetical protein
LFTLADLERVRAERKSKGILESVLFSVEKCPFAHSLSLDHSTDRGSNAEWLMKNKLIEYGFDVKYDADRADYDLLLNNHIRAEVKLATIREIKGLPRYRFQKIKPKCFDVLFFVFLGTHGSVVKWTTSEMFTEWSKDYMMGKEGYDVQFDDNRFCEKLIYNETFDSFIKTYGWQNDLALSSLI